MPNSPSRPDSKSLYSKNATLTKRSELASSMPMSTVPTMNTGALSGSLSKSDIPTSSTTTHSTKTNSPSAKPVDGKKVSSPTGSASLVTVGTITDPNATALELLAQKSPRIAGLEDHKNKNSSQASKTTGFSSNVARPSSTSVSLIQQSTYKTKARTPIITSGHGTWVISGNRKSPGSKHLKTETAAPGSGPVVKISETSQSTVPTPPASDSASFKQAQSSTSHAVEVRRESQFQDMGQSVASRQAYGHGVIDRGVSMRSGAKMEILFSLLGVIIFSALWAYLLSYSKCHNDPYWEYIVKVFAILGIVGSLFVLFHSCFERRVVIGRGIFGCIIFFILTLVIFFNLVSAYMGMSCFCRCTTGSNAFTTRQTEDITIFALALSGAFCLILVLLISSVAHEEP